jgi:adenylate cyclase
MGVGLNSGAVMAGSVGSEQRVEYTAIGDTTNTAARLEGMTKGSGTMLVIADSTRERLRRPVEDLSLVGEFEVRGRNAKLAVWTADAARIPADGAAEPKAESPAEPPPGAEQDAERAAEPQATAGEPAPAG